MKIRNIQVKSSSEIKIPNAKSVKAKRSQFDRQVEDVINYAKNDCIEINAMNTAELLVMLNKIGIDKVLNYLERRAK